MIGGLLQQNGKEHYERPHYDRDWSSPTGFKLTQGLPAEFKESKAYLDSRELYGKTFLRNIAATSWSSKYGLAGRPIADLRLTEILWKGFRNHHLRALSHGHFMALVVARKINEAVFASALLSGIRENKWDMEELARNFSRLIQNFVRKGDKVVLKSTRLYFAMLDLFITYQTSGPLNVRTLGRKFLQDVPIQARSSKYAYYYLPTPSQSRGLPGQLLTHASHTFLRSFDFLFSKGAITLPRENMYCLGMWGYNNVVPALRCRPPLLAGNLVSELLSVTLKAGVRSLRYTFRIPSTQPRPLPPELEAWSV